MKPLKHATSILKVAEGELRQLMQENITSGHYSDLPALASCADGLSSLISRLVALDADTGCEDIPPSLQSKDGRGSGSERSIRSVPKKKSSKATKSKKNNTKQKYPYFETGDGCIGKVGWSKKNREEYRHYAPVSAAVVLAQHIDSTQETGRVWTVESLGEVIDPEAGEALPSYQLYLVIAWMRSIDLVSKQGRSGYIAVGGGTLLPGVKKALSAA